MEWCLSPVIPSATTHESNDSIAPNNAIVIASGNTARIFSKENAGNVGLGSKEGIVPNLEPMVSTGSPNKKTTKEDRTITTMGAGILGKKCRNLSNKTKLVIPSPKAK